MACFMFISFIMQHAMVVSSLLIHSTRITINSNVLSERKWNRVSILSAFLLAQGQRQIENFLLLINIVVRVFKFCSIIWSCSKSRHDESFCLDSWCWSARTELLLVEEKLSLQWWWFWNSSTHFSKPNMLHPHKTAHSSKKLRDSIVSKLVLASTNYHKEHLDRLLH